MSDTRGLGFGSFLIGLGGGWVLFTAIDVSTKTLAWLLIVIGGAIVLSSLLPRFIPNVSISGIVSSLSFGLVIALLATSGLDFTSQGFWTSGTYKYSEEEPRNYQGIALASTVIFEVTNVNGNVEVSTWERSEYDIDLMVRGYGTSATEALNVLNQVETSVDEQMVGEQLEITLTVSVPSAMWRRVSVNVFVTLPDEATVDLSIETINGDISIAQLEGGTIDLKTSNGNLDFDDLDALEISGQTTNGRVQGVVEAEFVNGRTTNGDIDLNIPSTKSGSYDLSTTNGGVDIGVSEAAQVGFDLDVSVSNGRVTFDLEDLDYEVDTTKYKKAQTTGYTERAVRIEIEASTTNGNAEVSG